jgi:DNA repair protein RecN (Recombination protein N)
MKESRIKFDLDKSDKLNKYGIDNLNVLYSSDKGNNFNKLIKIASGGEKSRILLAINVLFSEKMSLPTLIFDEIDSGTSGKVANVIADLLKRIGNKSQVIAISHLPQVAAKASNHYKVSKILDQNKPKTLMKKLNHGERIKEIAAMISADNITNPALNQALELLK